MKKRVLSGIQPSGKLHIGNYLGAIRQHIDSQNQADWDRYFFIANYHSLTSHPDPETLREWTLDVARTYLALGLDPEKSLLFMQTDVPEVTELAWILTCLAPMGLLQRCTSYKDKVARGIEANHGLFAYPVLQAADILIYDSHFVPVGSDQKQHIEVCRDLAQKFNIRYGETLVVPDGMIKDEVAVIPGIDGQKMSKSYQNTIDLFGTKKELKKQVMRIETDSKGLEEPKDPDTCNVFALYKFFANKEEIAEMAANYRAGGYGYGHAKLALLEKLNHFLEPHRERYNHLVKNEDEVLDVLRAGAKTARATAQETMRRVRAAVGFIG
ncbi:tryptophan--tRNA ligase [Acanthopleuribacter pedis]|uniref:Tryptophan--tRNA ligase n=1 Tax=Acanthopleuribacter pedis TaxID=442870 RepID=A0A8J7QKY2_9BACT|nr:tryptophan--tRNA ligase [Acanthopleuribacter pedis]MBO1320153.1 tryptophan--tRNA ligase [Acanthopleuribacter pedis]